MFSHRMAKLSKICSLTVLLFLSIQAVFAAPGDLDLTFNGIGIVTTTVTNTNDAANAVAVQTDGKIIAAGYGANGTEFVLARYTASGALDTTFDTDGIVRYVYPNSNGMAINAMALQPDGKILVAGYIIPPGSSNRRFSLARYLTNGSLDSTFGTGGVVITPDVAFGLFISEINAIAIQADGKIVATGIAQSNVGIARYNTNGSLDTSFNSIGFVSTILTGGSEGNGVKIQTDGKIVVAGRSGAQFSTTTLVRYTANGSLDNSFDNDGIVTTAAGPGSAMVIQPDGKIVVVTETTADYNVIRYNTNGSLDTGFGTNGIAATNAGGSSDSAKGVALDAGGSILVTGFSGEPKLGVDVFLSRHNSNGSLDPTFDGGGDGVVITDIGTFLDESNAIALSNSKIVIVGKLRNSATDDDFAVLRYNGNTPTVANVTLGGRIIKPNGSGVSGVRVILTGGSLTGPRVSLTSSFGYYNFYDLPAGQTYIVTPESTRYTFSPTNQVISLVDEFLQANFTAN